MILLWLVVLLLPTTAQAAEVRDIIFPVIGSVSYSNDFGAPRSGHTHEGNDLLGKKLMPLVATVDGTLRYVAWPEPDYGYYVSITDSDGYQYVYIHINNDTPGTDDGSGGGKNAYAPYVDDGNEVTAGQLIGWMGDSGNAESTTPHLHFEIRTPDGTAFTPYDSLQAAEHISTPVIPGPIGDELLPFGEFTGGSSIALGNLDKDADLEVVAGAGPGGGPNVRVLNQSGSAISTFFAYDTAFRGGVDVATGDVNGDGIDEIITGAGSGGGPQVKIFSSAGMLLNSWFAYDEAFHGGISVAAADLDGDGKAEIITGPGLGGGPHVRIFNPRGTALGGWFAYAEDFHGGIDVAAQSATDSTAGRIVTAAGLGGGPQIRVFSRKGKVKASWFAYDEAFHGGVKVAVSDNAITTVPANNGGPDVRLFSIDGSFTDSTDAFEDWWTGGYAITQRDDQWWIASGYGGRRASIQPLNFSYSYSRNR